MNKDTFDKVKNQIIEKVMNLETYDSDDHTEPKEVTELWDKSEHFRDWLEGLLKESALTAIGILEDEGIIKINEKQRELVVYDSCSNEINFHETLEEAEKDYEEAKEYILEEAVTCEEKVYILEVKKVANLVEDEDRKDDPKEHGFDGWVKWKDN